MLYNELFKWQQEIVDNVATKGNSFGLFLDCGLGKTPIALALAEHFKTTKILIITINAKAKEKANVSGSWFDWAERIELPENKKYVMLNKKQKTFSNEQAEIFMINYESLFDRVRSEHGLILKAAVQDFIKSCRGHKVCMIIDESHKMKDSSAMQTKAIYQIKRGIESLCISLHTYLLTGTPFTTGFIDLYSQLRFMGYPMTKQIFKDTYCITGQIPGLLGWQQPIVGYKNLDDLYKLVHQFAITIKSEDVVKLPEKVFVNHTLPPTPAFDLLTKSKLTGEKINENLTVGHITFDKTDYDEPKRLYGNPFYRNLDFPELDYFADTPANFWLRSRQASIGFQGNAENSVWYSRARLLQLKRFLEQNPANYVLFYNYTPELLELYDICEELGYHIDIYCGEIKSLSYYDEFSHMSPETRIVTKKNIILANFASGSTGMNWQLYNQCIIFSLPLYKDYEQALKRIHRIGQKETVIYHLFYQENWLDKGMLRSLQNSTDYNEELFTQGILENDTE